MNTNTLDERLDRDAWIEAATDLLVKGSVDAVRVAPLAKELGVTKGSFYWHFKDRAALLQGILQTWRQRATFAIIERLDEEVDAPENRLTQIIQLPYSRGRARAAALVEFAIRSWARRDDVAAAAVAEVDSQRLAFLAAQFRRMGYDEKTVKARSYLVYSYNLAENIITVDGNVEDKAALRRTCLKHLMKK